MRINAKRVLTLSAEMRSFRCLCAGEGPVHLCTFSSVLAPDVLGSARGHTPRSRCVQVQAAAHACCSESPWIPEQVIWSNTFPHTLDAWEEQNVGGEQFLDFFFHQQLCEGLTAVFLDAQTVPTPKTVFCL